VSEWTMPRQEKGTYFIEGFGLFEELGAEPAPTVDRDEGGAERYIKSIVCARRAGA
jgi:hypothetical protein